MKKFSILSFFSFVCILTNAQFKTIAEGPVFDEPQSGYSKIIQMKNGNTIFFHITNRGGINLNLFDTNHKQKVIKHLEPSYGRLKQENIKGIFEINGDAMLMISEVVSQIPVLYRIIIDGINGELKSDEKIAQMARMNLKQENTLIYKNVSLPDFYIRKDPDSDNYAVAMFNSVGSGSDQRIEITHYGLDHKETGRALYTPSDVKYKYMKFMDMVVIGSEKVSVLAYLYNTAVTGSIESIYVLANLDSGKKYVNAEELEFSHNHLAEGGIIRYNPITKKLILLSLARLNGPESPNETELSFIDPFQVKFENSINPFPEQASKKSQELYREKLSYSGLPQNLFINTDGGFSVAFEEISVSNFMSSSGNKTPSTKLGDIAVSVFDREGMETHSYLVPKNHNLANIDLGPFYHSDREWQTQPLSDGNQFRLFAYLCTTDKTYVFFNDIESNGERLKKGKVVNIVGVKDSDGFYFDLSGSDVLPERQFVFGKPQSKGEHNLALFTISDYNRNTNIYATLKLEKKGKHKGVKLVWLQPQ